MKIVSCLFLSSVLLPLLASCVEKQVCIVHVGEPGRKKPLHEIEETHLSYLNSVKETEEEAKSSLLYSYKHAINGFAALLTPEEASKLSESEEVASVFATKGRVYSSQTTRSWEFAGLKEKDGLPWNTNKMGGEDLLAKASYGKDVIVGVLDSGVWPESPSFSDDGMEPIPQSWKGTCQEGVAFNSSHCNKKIIGARYYVKGYEQKYGKVNASEDCLSPRDMDGHGSHTASTAAGRHVRNAAAVGGFAKGTASGGAPLARLAIYKVCWAIPNASKVEGNTCFYEDMLAGMDDAIGDGVDIISVSIVLKEQLPYEEDVLAIGALHAAKRNILVVCSAGNNGPKAATLSNTAPWLITVAASSLDREFLAPVKLGNGSKILGQSITEYRLRSQMYPLINAEDAVVPNLPRNNNTGQCLPDSLDPNKVKGKIVVCWRGAGTRLGKGLEVKRARGAGFILANSPATGNEIALDSHVLPASSLTYKEAAKILEYVKYTPNPKATICPGKTVLHYKPAPFMAGFSSKGPNVIDPNILKPDITAPGLNILAAWSEASSPTKWEGDRRRVKYNLYSGTSMSCPHVSGAAALLKAIHPDWSISAIRSALMTTARMTNNLGKLITDEAGDLATPFNYGAGHFRPIKAADPGLIYDASYDDYLLYLCSIGQNKLDPTFKCPKNPPSALNLNYPSFAIPNLNGTFSIKRTVTNVGRRKSTYFFSANPPPGVHVKASPSLLCFDHLGQKQSFTITVSPGKLYPRRRRATYEFGWYTWADGFYRVRSPMAVYLP